MRNDTRVVPCRENVTFLWWRRFIPPHQSLTRQLPPKGKPSLHCANKVNRTLNRGLPSRPALIRRLRRQTASSLSRKRLMRGDKSLPTQRLQNLMPPHQSGAKPHFQKNHLPSKPKTSLHGNRRTKNAENPYTPIWRLPCREVRGGSGRFGG